MPQNGMKHRNLFQMFKDVNAEIAAVAHIFLGGSVRECRFTHISTFSNGFTVGLSKPMGFLSSVAEKETATRGFLLSHIVNLGQEYIVIMNIHPTETREAYLTFSESAYAEYPQPDFPGLAIKGGNVTLPPGRWAIYRRPLCPAPDLTD